VKEHATTRLRTVITAGTIQANECGGDIMRAMERLLDELEPRPDPTKPKGWRNAIWSELAWIGLAKCDTKCYMFPDPLLANREDILAYLTTRASCITSWKQKVTVLRTMFTIVRLPKVCLCCTTSQQPIRGPNNQTPVHTTSDSHTCSHS
jgi:hypothetical protein